MSSLLISASPRAEGRSAQLAAALFEAWPQEKQERTTLFSLADHAINPCTACDACKQDYHCIIGDDMQLLYPLFESVDDLTIVSPVFFAGPPAQLKALLDRLQPYFWKSIQEGRAPKRPASLYVVGEGGDPHGFEALVISTRSALAVTGFSLENVYNCVQLEGEEFRAVAKRPEAFRA